MGRGGRRVFRKCKKDTGTKPKGGRIKDGEWEWLGWRRSGGGEIEKTVLE